MEVLPRCNYQAVKVSYVCDEVTTRTAIRPNEVAHFARVHFDLRSKHLSHNVEIAICDVVNAISKIRIADHSAIKMEELDWRMSFTFWDRNKNQEVVFVFDDQIRHCWHKGLVLDNLDEETLRLVKMLKSELERTCAGKR